MNGTMIFPLLFVVLIHLFPTKYPAVFCIAPLPSTYHLFSNSVIMLFRSLVSEGISTLVSVVIYIHVLLCTAMPGDDPVKATGVTPKVIVLYSSEGIVVYVIEFAPVIATQLLYHW